MSRLRRLVVLAVVVEVRMYVGLLRLLARRTDVPGATTAHRYVGAVAALLWGFTGVSAVELVVLHLVIAWEPVRLAADVVGIWGLVWCAGMTGCHYVYPHLSDAAGLRVRSARRRPLVVLPWSDVTAVAVGERSHDSSKLVVAEHAHGPALVVPVGGRTNVEVRLARSVAVELGHLTRTTHEVSVVQLFADDARSVRAAWREVVGTPSAP